MHNETRFEWKPKNLHLNEHLKLLRFTDPQITCRTNRNINFNLQNKTTDLKTEQEGAREKISIYFYQPHPTAFVFIIQHIFNIIPFVPTLKRLLCCKRKECCKKAFVIKASKLYPGKVGFALHKQKRNINILSVRRVAI